ncbi:hypothetical protein [Nocardioides marmorisolisilvae]|uniref:Uncharacterized protein n=1 Tax=Nocardioides marmorisolisilvae TaxID=1542737 RepID=A0A3N0DSC5_9ACTN|nr:hypothetical protein [Nocardioides marmorisolisilvae]RNL78537.1 hypothetical protein EFL95_05440 [Nocardioides marmorisolisilvae]
MFLTVVALLGALLVIALVLAWRADRRGTGRDKHIRPPGDDSAVGRAKASRWNRGLGGMGPGRGP